MTGTVVMGKYAMTVWCDVKWRAVIALYFTKTSYPEVVYSSTIAIC